MGLWSDIKNKLEREAKNAGKGAKDALSDALRAGINAGAQEARGTLVDTATNTFGGAYGGREPITDSRNYGASAVEGSASGGFASGIVPPLSLPLYKSVSFYLGILGAVASALSIYNFIVKRKR